MVRLRLALAALLVSGCFVDSLGLPPPSGGAPSGSGGEGGDPNLAGSGSGEGGLASGGGGGAPLGGAPAAQHCPPGELATDISDGTLACAPVSDIAMKAIADSCSVFYGWRDGCDVDCVEPPNRSGKVSTNACQEFASGDSSCQAVTLGADQAVQLFGFDLDGDPSGNDRFYSAISCTPGATGSAPCDANGGFVTAYEDGTAMCSRIAGAVLDYVRPSCALVRGWSDFCGGTCTTIAKQVSSTSLACDAGMGGHCEDVTLGGDMVELASFDVDNDPSDDDRFYFGLRCEEVTSMESVARGACPAGQFVVGLEVDGSLVCSDLQEASMTAFRERCSLFAGWKDSCDACTDAPMKWGRVRDGECVNNSQPDDSCSTTVLDNQTVDLYGLNLDGIVDSNDKFYMGFRCQ